MVGTDNYPDRIDDWCAANASEPTIARRLQDPMTFVAVVEDRDQIGLLGTGYASITNERCAYIGGLCCTIQSRGIGTLVANHLLQWSKDQNSLSVEMTIAKSNTTMQHLAASMGFVKEREFSNDYLWHPGSFGKWYIHQ